MFGLFKRNLVDPMAHPSVAVVRSDARALIRLANTAERSASPAARAGELDTQAAKDRTAMASGEVTLTSSIRAALSGGERSVQAITSDVIRPLLEEAIVVSETAHRAILRATSTAESR
jgi:phage gp29-like protein